MFKGCYTALITPMKGMHGDTIDFKALGSLVEFQIASGVSGILAVGTTGESPTLNWEEHQQVILKVYECGANRCAVIAGTGSNCTRETLHASKHACKHGVKNLLLVDPYYNGPSSLEIRKEYVEPVAEALSDVQIVLYTIPGRTGCQLLPEDIAILHKKYPNVQTVKEATGDIENMRKVRKVCGDSLTILSGDDDKTFEMMTHPEIRAAGVVSVMSNIAPRACQQMTQAILDDDMDAANRLRDALAPLFKIVTVKTEEETPFGPTTCKARNPLAVKTLMNLLGMPAGPCRGPLGKMTRTGFGVVLETARTVWRESAEILKPIEEAFNVSIDERLGDSALHESLIYEGDPYAT